MKVCRIAFSILLSLTAFGPAAFAQDRKPDTRDPQYMMGYQAGRRDERADLCGRFEKHSTVAAGLLGEVRMALIRTFCATRF
jgi:hypothetical protein